jgi:guanylate kinase
MKQFVLAITGPAGSGKSTVAYKLVHEIEKCTNIDADLVKHMVTSGFTHETLPDGTKKWGFAEWALVGECIGVLARKFYDSGHNVIINGYIDVDGWHNVEKQIKLIHKVLLFPEANTAIRRDTLRQAEYVMGEETVREHHDYFSTNKFYSGFTKINTTNHTANETTQEVKDLLAA